MANSLQQTILDTFHQAAGSWSGGSSPPAASGLLANSSQNLGEALAQATQVISAQTLATAANTDAVVQETSSRSKNGSGVADAVSSVSRFLGGGLSLIPLVSIFTGLFGGGDKEPAPAILPYALPSSMHVEATNNYQDVSYGQDGLPRATTVSIASESPAPQITVQVQAMDSRSFLDHSDEIAQAVRQAMLNMNSINDVVTDL